MASDREQATDGDLRAIWATIQADLAALGTESLWAELRVLETFAGGSQDENLRLAALVQQLAERDDNADDLARGARVAFETWKAGPNDGGDSGHIVLWMLKAAPSTQ